MIPGGWIKIHRKMVAWEWYHNPTTFCVWMHLLIEANHEPKEWNGLKITAGQLVTSLNSLVKSTGLSMQQVRTALNNIQNTQEITIKATNRYSIITICKYADYQCQKKRSNKEGNKDSNMTSNTDIILYKDEQDKNLIKKGNNYGKQGKNGEQYDPRRGTDVPSNPHYGQGFQQG